jgi:hypothetical protein
MSAEREPVANGTNWRGLPMKRPGETFGQYRDRITVEQEIAITKAARMIGVQPRSIFESYLPTEPRAEGQTSDQAES